MKNTSYEYWRQNVMDERLVISCTSQQLYMFYLEWKNAQEENDNDQ